MGAIRETRIKVGIKEVTPYFKKNEIFIKGRCYTGVSISNPFYANKSKSFAYFQWIAGNFDKCLVFIDDLFHQYNIKAFTNESDENCLNEAKQYGDFVENKILQVVSKYNCTENKFRIIKSTELSNNLDYLNGLNIFQNLFKYNQSFNDSLRSSACDYVDRQIERGNHFKVSRNMAIELSCQYLINELAVFLSICKMGYSVEVYPGKELLILREIAEKKYPEVPKELVDRINVELKLKRK